MSWLKLNDSINNLKGQISNFASNVLADEDEGSVIKNSDYEELKKICVQQEIQIQNLKRIIEDNGENVHRNGTTQIKHASEHWNWDADADQNGAKEKNAFDNKTISDLKQQIEELKNERTDMLGQLEQLDLENQQNLSQIVAMKDKLQEENNELQENYDELTQLNKTFAKREEKLRGELHDLRTKLEKEHSTDGYRDKFETLLQENQNLKSELEELRKEISVLKSLNETLQKIIEDSKAANEEEALGNREQINRLTGENKIVYAELRKAKETIKSYEIKSLEDADNCQKLASILESYEKQVGTLKEELQDVRTNSSSACHPELIKKLEIDLKTTTKKYESDLSCLQEELNNLKYQNENIGQDNDSKTEDKLRIEELEALKDAQEMQINSLEEEVRSLRQQNEKLQITTNTTNNEDNLRIEALESFKEEQNAQIASLKEELNNFKMRNETLQSSNSLIEENLSKLDEALKELRQNQDDALLQLHKKYISILTENIKRFQECETPSDFHHCFYEDDTHIADFSKQVEQLLKILLDFKCKCEALDNKVYNLTQDKTNILTEKNHEIERLIQNSEILSQEVITKTQTIKEVENECIELAKNNDLLINELEAYKSNSGLQTISESNEDNLIILESQLENANKRIEVLEKIVYDFEKQQKNKVAGELENAVEQVNLSEIEVNTKEKDYQDLLNTFDELQIEYETLKDDHQAVTEDLKLSNQEIEELKTNLEKVTTDYENAEYQLSEVNVNTDSLKEELEGYKFKVDTLIKENGKLQMLHEETMKDNEDIRTELNVVREKLMIEEDARKKFEITIRNMTEKLQNAKMAETSLKLQYDTVSKEIAVLSEAKHNLEVTVNKTNNDLEQFQNNFVEIQLQNDIVVAEHEELKRFLQQKEEQIENFKKMVDDLQNKLNYYKKLDEYKDLSNKSLIAGDNASVKEELQCENLSKDKNEQLQNTLFASDTELQLSNVDLNLEENRDYEELQGQFDTVLEEKNNLQLELNKYIQAQGQLAGALKKNAFLQQQMQEISVSRNELINIVTTKHQENIAYHNEIQRLQQFLTLETEKCKNLEAQLHQQGDLFNSNAHLEEKTQEIEKLTDQNNFLKEKCEIMAKNLLEEQSKVQKLLTERSSPSEKEVILQKKLDRLQAHLIELEERYTQELLQAEQKNGELQAKLQEIIEREKSSSTMYTSVSIRANQQVESLQNQLQTIVNERDSLRKQISDAEDMNSQQAAALTNLQIVLEHFRRDKEKDVQKETERIRRQIQTEKQVQDELKKEISNLKLQLEESKQGLQAASRLSDQLEGSKKLVSMLREEVSQLQEKLSNSEEELKATTSQTDGKVDKSLIKNLIIGFISSNKNLNKDQVQILKIIATVLDFNQQDQDKINLNKPQQGSWLGFLAPQSGNQNMSQESLSQAFIKFLEQESQPRTVPSLLNAGSDPVKSSTSASGSATLRQSPIILSEIVLPTFADFGQNRNSSSILKDVLKDNS